MFRNYFILALRNIFKKAGYSILNVFGLVLGITCCLLIFQYVAYQRSYDSFHKKGDQIVRLRLDLTDQGKLNMQSAAVYPGVPPLMKKEFPEVENYCRLIDTRISWSGREMVQNNLVFANEERNIRDMENHGYYADPFFLQMFSIPFINGNLGTALDGPNKIILSQTTAKKYFGNGNAIGKNMTVREGGRTYHYEVTGVFKDYPGNSHLSFNYLISYSTFRNLVFSLGAPEWADPETSLAWYDYYDYLQLKEGTDLQKFQSKVTAFADRYLNNEYSRAHNNRQDLFVMPLKDIHLYSHYNEEAGVNGDGKSVSFLFLIAFLIIIIAWVNYTNLSTARSLERAKEVGVRKVLGALRRDLIGQFLAESFLLNLISLVLAALLVFVLTTPFNKLMGSLTVPLQLPLSYWQKFALLFLAGSFLSGMYPALVLSGYHPIAVLKGLFKNSTRGMVLRKGLIVGQFAVSIVLMAGTIIIYQQVHFMMNQKLGADISQVLVLNGPNANDHEDYANAYQPFRNDVLQLDGVKTMTASSSVMGREIYMSNGAYLVNATDKSPKTFYTLYVDEDFLSSYNMDFKAGHNYSKEVSDKRSVIINEEAARLFGINDPSKAVGQLINNYRDTLEIIGVVSNYHQLGLSRSILPTLFVLKPEVNNFYSVRFETAGTAQTIERIKKLWAKHFPADPFSYFFLDESFNQQYKADQQFGKVFGLFSLIAILIACLGLLSLSAYNVLQRTKEIGVRKVLGAPVSNLLFLLSKDFLLLVFIGFIVAVPAAWMIMSEWLGDFAYRINISWWVFLIAGCMAMLIALVTISVQALKAALANPVKSLRTE